MPLDTKQKYCMKHHFKFRKEINLAVADHDDQLIPKLFNP